MNSSGYGHRVSKTIPFTSLVVYRVEPNLEFEYGEFEVVSIS
jgi:hypothetical protein